MTSVSSNAGPSFDYLYHRNLQLQKAIYSNGVVGVYGKGDANLVRPKRGPDGRILRESTEQAGDWTDERDLVYGAEGAEMAIYRSGKARFFHADHLGTPRLITDGEGEPLARIDHYPFGYEAQATSFCTDGSFSNVTVSDTRTEEACGELSSSDVTVTGTGDLTLRAGSRVALGDGFSVDSGGRLVVDADADAFQSPEADLSIKYTGHQRERHRHTDYMLGRHYFVLANRFASVDPARDGWNLYAYARGNPVAFLDPNGRESVGVMQNVRARELTGDELALSPQEIRDGTIATAVVGSLLIPGPEDVVLAAAGTKLAARAAGKVGSFFRKLFGGGEKAGDLLDTAQQIEQVENSLEFQKKALEQTRTQLDNGRNQLAREMKAGNTGNPHGLRREVLETLPEEIKSMEKKIRELTRELESLRSQ